MGILDKLKGELIDIIQWLEEDDSTIAYRFERYGNEIKNGAQLTVREGQTAVFVNEGQIADVFGPGMYELQTENLPILSTLKGWKHGFESPFKAEVYFISNRIITGFGWGTPSPFRLRDPEFGVLETTARGAFSFHVVEPKKFIKNVIGTDGEFTKDEIKDRLRKKFVTEAISAIAESKKSFYEMAEHYDELSGQVKDRVNVLFMDLYGISIDEASLQSIDLTERSAEKVEKRDDLMFQDGRMNMYERKARADAMVGLANNPGAGGLAAGGMGLGMGLAAGGQMAQSFASQAGMGMSPGGQMAPPPAPGYFVYANGQQLGPYPPQTLNQFAQQGRFTPQTQVWRQGMQGWVAAAMVPELAGLFRAPQGGPPPPGPAAPPPPSPPPAGAPPAMGNPPAAGTEPQTEDS